MVIALWPKKYGLQLHFLLLWFVAEWPTKKQLATKIQLFQVGLKRWRLTQTPMKHLTSSGRAVAVASQQMLELLLLSLLFAFNFY